MKHIYKQLALLIFILGSTALQAQFLTPEGTDEFLGGGSNGGTGGDVIIKLPINNRCDGCENLEDLVFSNSSSLNNAIANDLRIEAAAREEAEEWYKKQTVIMHNFLNNFLGRNFSNYNEAKTELFKKSEQRNISYTQPIVERKFDQLHNSAAIAKRRSLYGLRALQQREREIRSGNTSNSLYSDILVNDIPLRNITDLSTLNRERNKILSDGFNRKMYEEHQYKFLFDLLGSRNSFRSDLEAETLRRKNQIHDSYNFWDKLNYMQLLIQTELIKRNGVSTVPFSPSQQNVFSRFYNKLEIASAQLIEDFARKRYSGDKLSIFHPDYWKVILFKNFNGDPFSQAQAYGEHQRLMNNERTKAIANTPLGTNLSVDYLVNKLSITDKNQYEWLNANPQKAINYEKLIKDYKNNSVGGEFGNTLVGDLNLSNGNDTDFVNLGDPTDFVTEAITNGGLVQEMIKELNITSPTQKNWLYNNEIIANRIRTDLHFNDNTFSKNLIDILSNPSINQTTKITQVRNLIDNYEPELNTSYLPDYEYELSKMAGYLKWGGNPDKKVFGEFIERLIPKIHEFKIFEVQNLYKEIRKQYVNAKFEMSFAVLFTVVESFKPVVEVSLYSLGGYATFTVLKALPLRYLTTELSLVLTRLSAIHLPVVVSTTSTAYKALLHASKYGIQTYSQLQQEFVNLGLTRTNESVQFHHLIEQRFNWNPDVLRWLGSNTNSWKSIVLTKTEHQLFTNAWKDAITRDGMLSTGWTGARTSTATLEQIKVAAREIYKNYPEILEALGLN